MADGVTPPASCWAHHVCPRPWDSQHKAEPAAPSQLPKWPPVASQVNINPPKQQPGLHGWVRPFPSLSLMTPASPVSPVPSRQGPPTGTLASFLCALLSQVRALQALQAPHSSPGSGPFTSRPARRAVSAQVTFYVGAAVCSVHRGRQRLSETKPTSDSSLTVEPH